MRFKRKSFNKGRRRFKKSFNGGAKKSITVSRGGIRL